MVEKQKSTSFLNEKSASKTTKDKKTDKKQITSFFSSKDKNPAVADDKSGTESNQSSLAPKKERKVTPRKLVKNSKAATKENNNSSTLNPETDDGAANGDEPTKPKGRGRPKKQATAASAATKVVSKEVSSKQQQQPPPDESMANDDQNQEEEKQEVDHPMEEEDEDFNMDEVEVEQASDDEEDADSQEDGFEEMRKHATRGARKRKRALDDESDDDQTPFNMNEQFRMDLPEESDEPEESSEVATSKSKRKKKAAQKKADKAKKAQADAQAEKVDESKLQEEEEDEDVQYIDNLPTNETDLKQMLGDVRRCIKKLEKQFFEEEDSDQERDLMDAQTDEQRDAKLLALQQQSHIKQFWCVPLSDDVLALDVDKMMAKQKEMTGGRLFDVITADPPWQLSTANPTRGVAIAYDSMSDTKILDIPFEKLQTDGFLFIWVINNKYRFALRLFDKFGYKLIDELTWVKQTVNGKIAKGHGYYLQHAKETCLVGVKGDVSKIANFNIESDVIFSQRRGQSQKPEEIYEIAESLVPNGYYLEIFGRRNNLHNGWVTIGNEL